MAFSKMIWQTEPQADMTVKVRVRIRRPAPVIQKNIRVRVTIRNAS